jgi:signal transduction histidine kinase
VATRVEGNSVVVEIGDTGPGMPPHGAARAFEAFYTTKDALTQRVKPSPEPNVCGVKKPPTATLEPMVDVPQ